MSEKIIGVLGGMGPEATLDCFDKLIKNTPADKDQERVMTCIYKIKVTVHGFRVKRLRVQKLMPLPQFI